MKKILAALWLAILVLLAVLPMTQADVPTEMSYQGYLTDRYGDPMTGVVDLAFGIYNQETGGTLMWGEEHSGVEVVDGIFSVVLGSQGEPLDHRVFVPGETWLEIWVNKNLIEPRTKLTTTGYAYRVSTVDSAQGGRLLGDVSIAGVIAPDSGVVTHGAIKIESIDDNVLIVAGPTQILVDQYGVVTITSYDVSITAENELNLTAYSDLTLNASGNLSLEGTNVDISANSSLTMEGSAGSSLTSSAVTTITGSLVQIN